MTEKEKRIELRESMGLRIYVVGGGFQYLKMFWDAGFKGAANVEDADIVCFTGGEDVDPSLYGEKVIQGTNFNRGRDDKEMMIFGESLGLKKPMIGICRGGQFLNVMNGGRLWQNVNNHCSSHSILDVHSNKLIHGMTSTHHQMMIPCEKDGIVLAYAAEATVKEGYEMGFSRPGTEMDDVEVVWYDTSNSLCFQPHPEFYDGPCRDYFLDLVDDYVLPAT